MKFITFVKGLIRQLFAPDQIRSALGVKPALTPDTADRLKLWADMYTGHAPWLSDDIRSLRVEQGVVREFANIAVGEMTATVSDANLDAAFQAVLRNFNVSFQSGLATGALVIKPMPDLSVQFLPQNAFIPLSYDIRGRLIDVIFPETVKDDERYLTRLEWHHLDETGLTIINRAFVSYSENSLGIETSLSILDKWTNIAPETRYPGMTRPIYGYYRNPIDNTIDGSNAGVSIFDPAVDLSKIVDTQFGRLDWEFESGERAIHVDPAALKKGEDGKFHLPKLSKRLYRAVDIDTGKDGKGFFEAFSPEFRETSIIAGLEEFKRAIEFAVGLSYGDISNPQTVEKTATEILAAKKRKYNTVNAIQQNLRDCLDDLVFALAFWSAKTTSGYEFVCDFKDSILIDEETERQQDRADVSMGVMRLEEYRAKWYGESVEDALKNLPERDEVVM